MMLKGNESLIFILLLFISLSINQNSSISADYFLEIHHIQLVTQPLVQGEDMSVRIQFVCDTNVSFVWLIVYFITEDASCLYDSRIVIMKKITTTIRCPFSKRFEGNYSINEPNGTQIAYRIQIYYENTTVILIPNMKSFMDLEVIEPFTGCLLFNAGIVGESEISTTNNYSIFTMGLSCFCIVYLVGRKRKKVS